MTPVPSTPHRVLLIKPSAIGDVVHSLPILALMRDAWPQAHIAWLVTPACAGLLHNHPLLNEVILFDRKRFGQGHKSLSAATGLLRFLLSLRHRFDLVVDLQGLFRSGFISFMTRAPHRIGMAYAREGAPIFYTTKVPAPPHGLDQVHALERYLDVAQALGLPRSPVRFVSNTSDADRNHIAHLCPPDRYPRFALLLPGTNWDTKKWPAPHFAKLAQLLRTHLNLPSVLAGGPADAPLASTIQSDLSLAGQTTLPQTTALIERATVVIANDTGPMHIAAALGKPLVALYGPTSHLRTGPYNRPDSVLRLNLPCAPCLSRTCSHQSCLQWLTPEAVLNAVTAQLTQSEFRE